MKNRFPKINLEKFLPSPIKAIYLTIKEKVSQNIRVQLILVFGISLIIAIYVSIISSSLLGWNNRYSYIDYSAGIFNIDHRARMVVNRFSNYDMDTFGQEDIERVIIEESRYDDIKILIVDLDGDVVIRSENATETRVDLHSIIKNAMNVRINQTYYSPKEFFSFYPINLGKERAYLIVSGMPQPQIMYSDYSNPLLDLIIGIATFIFVFLMLTKKKMRYMREITLGLLEISKGNLDFRVDKKSHDELGELADNINHMAAQLKEKMDRERIAEKTKNELITNVSHDLKTPLTSIMGYLRLVKDKRYQDQDQLDNYIDIAYGKSDKLKVLIEDLFEYTKITNQDVKINKKTVYLNELLEQLIEELVPICEENSLSFAKEITNERVMVEVDADKMVRVFENLLINAIKYSDKPGKIKVRMIKKNDKVIVAIRNRGESISQEDLSRLFDRFYRVEKSRSSDTGGSGLGLAISKSIVELHGGEIWAECEENMITLFVQLSLNNSESVTLLTSRG